MSKNPLKSQTKTVGLIKTSHGNSAVKLEPAKNDRNFIKTNNIHNKVLDSQICEFDLNDGVKSSGQRFRQTEVSSFEKNTILGRSDENYQPSLVLKTCETHRDALKVNATRMGHDSRLDEDICVVCYNNESNAVIMNCGHSDICEDCAKEIWLTSKLCYMCQQPINYMARVEKVSENVVEVKYCIYLK